MTAISFLSPVRIKGALTLADDVQSLPANAEPGTLLIKEEALYAYIRIGGVLTWYPLIRQPERYVHTQTAPNDVWTIIHNLGSTDIWYQVQDSNGQMMMPADVEVVDAYTLRLTFTEPTQGKVLILSTGLQGEQGVPGVGVPPGGEIGQVITKTGPNDFDTGWSNPTGGGGSASITGSYPGEFSPQVGTIRWYARNDIELVAINAWMSGPTSSDVVANIRRNGVVVASITIPAGQDFVSNVIAVPVLANQYLTTDIASGYGSDLVVRLDY